MAKLARESLSHYYPATIDIYINGVKAGDTFRLSQVYRTASITAVVVNKGLVNKHVSPAPPDFFWSLVPLAGCNDLKYLSPRSATTRLEIINATDRWVISVEVVTQYETLTKQVEITRAESAGLIPSWFFTGYAPFAPLNADPWSYMVVDQGRIIVWDNAGSLWYSLDAITWTIGITVSSFTPSPGSQVGAVCWGGGRYVATASQVGGANVSFYSEDGATWVETVMGFVGFVFIDVKYLNGQFVSVAYHDNLDEGCIVCTSPDGVTWNVVSVIPDSIVVPSIAYRDGMYVAVGSTPPWQFCIWYSDDLVTWTIPVNGTIPDTMESISVVATDDGFATLARGHGSSYGPFPVYFATSPNGIDWTITVLNTTILSQTPLAYVTDNFYYQMAYGNGVYVCPTYDNTIACHLDASNDLVSWVHSEEGAINQPLPGYGYSRVAFGDGRFVACLYNGLFAVSI